MKKLFSFKHGKKAEKPLTLKVTIGITESDWMKIYKDIQQEYADAHMRQVKPDASPNQYMRGLSKALEIMETIRPYKISEVQ